MALAAATTERDREAQDWPFRGDLVYGAFTSPGVKSLPAVAVGRRADTWQKELQICFQTFLPIPGPFASVATNIRSLIRPYSAPSSVLTDPRLLPSPQPRTTMTHHHLLSLPDDLISKISYHICHAPENPASAPYPTTTVDYAGYSRGAALAQTCTHLASTFYTSLDAITLPSIATLDDGSVAALARRAGPATTRLVLRSCTLLGNASVLSIAAHMTSLRWVDLSFLPSLTDASIIALTRTTHRQLRKLLVRKCTSLTDASLAAIALCTNLETLDISHIGPALSDSGVVAIAAAAGTNLRLLSLSRNPSLTDVSLCAIGAHCPALVQLCARSLPLITDHGVTELCRGVGRSARGLDFIDCAALTKYGIVDAFGRYCPAISVVDPEGHSLKHVLISGLRANIFIVRGIDPSSKQDTVHTCLVDTGDIASACILMAGTSDLSLVSLVLAKNFGTSLDETTVQMLSSSYGLPTELLT